jgi:hypothetical protein
MADREGFEPSVTLLPHTLSKRAHSTTLTPALGGRDARNSIRSWQSLFENFKNDHSLVTRARIHNRSDKRLKNSRTTSGTGSPDSCRANKLRSARRATARE